jgi:uncharacterized protein (TIGR02246 family)
MSARLDFDRRTVVSADEKSIRELIEGWERATADGDLKKLLGMMDDDVVFLVPGKPPMRGRPAFADTFRAILEHFRIASKSEIQDLQVSQGLASCWSEMTVTIKPLHGGAPMRRTGHVITVLRKSSDGTWRILRDANMLVADPPPSAKSGE